MRGAKRKPEAIKIAQGTRRKVRTNHAEPASDGRPANPFDAGTVAFCKFEEIATGLVRLGITDAIDATLLQGFCQAFEMATEADAEIKRNGITYLKDGDIKKNPACTVSADAWNKIRSYGNDLGLCYLARQRMESKQTKPEADKAQKYLA